MHAIGGGTRMEITLEVVVDVRAVTKTYRTKAIEVPAVRNATFTLHAGEFVALTGPSGCGKSTLLNLLACVDSPTSGTVTIDGRDVSGLNDDDLTRVRRQRIGYVFQFFNLIPTMTVRENVELPLLLAGTTRARAKAAVDAALERTSITDQASKLPAYLSGGQQQRAAIARAVVHEPALVLADEPTGNLDSATGDEILELLRSCATKGAAVLMATHSVEAAAKAGRRLRMRDGALES
jgi:putative ABC transport system ATP-binding protein